MKAKKKMRGSSQLARRRKRAEALLQKSPQAVSNTPADEVQNLAHGLSIHQMELEMQNEELRRVQIDLENSRDRFARLYDLSPVGYLTLDAGGVICEANLSAARLLGLNRQALLKKKLSSFVAAESLDHFCLHRQQVFSTAGRQSCELKMHRPDCVAFTGRLETVVETAGQGQPEQCLVMLSDVTERLRAEEILRLTNARLSMVQQAAGAGIWDWDLTTGKLTWSPELFRLFRLDPEKREANFDTWRSLVHGDDRQAAEERIEDAVQHQVPLNSVYRVVLPTGEVRWIHALGNTLCDELGAAQRIAGMCIDITARKECEQALQETQERLRALFENTPEGIVIADLNTKKLIQWNAAFSQMLGYTEADIASLSVEDIHPADSVAQVLAHLERIARRKTKVAEEIQMRRKDGTMLLAEIRSFPVTIAGTAQLVASFRAVTERERVEKQRVAFFELAHRLSASSTPQQAGERILEVASTFFSWDAAYVHAYSPTEDRVTPFITFDTIDGQAILVPAQTLTTEPTSLMRFVLREGAQLISRRDELPAAVKLRTFGNTQRRSASLMFAPIRSGGKSVGLLSVQSYTPSAYSPLDLKLLQALGDHCGDAIHRITIAEELLAADVRYRSIIQNATEGIFQTTPEGRFRSANPALARMLGYDSPEELIASTTDIVRQYYVASPPITEFKQLLENQGGVEGFEAECPRRDGSRIWVSINAHVVRDAGGAVLYYEGTALDVTERKQAQAVLRESEEKFRALFESAPIGIALHAASGSFIHSNRVYQQMLGYTEEELKRLGVKRITLADDVAEGQRLFGELCEGTRDSYQREKRYLSRDGRLIWAKSSASAVRDHLGRLRFIISMVEDITGRKQAEDQIHLLVNSVHSTHELICITDQKNRFQFVNRAFLKAYGYSEQELLGRQPDFLYAPVNRPRLCEQVYQQTLRGGWQGEIVNRRKDGTEFPIALNTSQIQDGAGRILGLVGVARDISAQKRAEKQSSALSLLGHQLSAATTPEQVAHFILEIAAELLGWDAGYLHLYSQTEDKIIRVLTVDTVDGQRRPTQPPRTGHDPTPLMRLVLKEGARLINRVNEAADPIELEAFGDLQRHSSSMIYVPIHSSEDILGILSIQSYTPLKYSGDDMQLLQILADHCGEALLRIKVTEARRAAEAKYQRIFEESTEGIVQTTPEGRFRSANPAAAHMLGYETPEELVASVTDIGRQTYVLSEKREEMKRLMATQGFIEGFEVERYRKDGSKLWMNINGHEVRDASGAVLYYEGTHQDITQRKLAEAVLRTSEARLRLLNEQVPAIIWTTDLDLKFTSSTGLGLTTLNLKTNEVVGRSLYQFFDTTDESFPPIAAHRRALRGQRTGLEIDWGKRFWSANIEPLAGDGGRLIGCIAVAVDITERKLAEEESRRLPQRIIEAQETERLRVARELHDGVNQLLASAKMRLRNVEENFTGFSPAAREILKRCNRLLVQALEENRRIAHDLRPSDLDELGLVAACRNLCTEFQSRANLVVKAGFPRDWQRQPPAVELNLFRIVQEALSNVEKHAQAKTVRLRLAVEDNVVVLRIQDDGRGFDSSVPPLPKKSRGGIGLTNLRERAASMGGTSEFVSVPKQGTRITVRVPFSNAK